MKSNYIIVITLTFFTNSVLANYFNKQKDYVSQLEYLTSKYMQLKVEPVELEFANFWARLTSTINKATLQKDLVDLKVLSQQSRLLYQKTRSSKKLSSCQLSHLSQLLFSFNLARERTELLINLQQMPVKFAGDFTEMESGSLWYKHWLKSWLMDDISVNQLKNIAYNELQEVNQKYIELRTLSLPVNNVIFDSTNEKAIISAFKKRERRVNNHLLKVFNTSFVAPPVTIIESSFPKNFPAPGIYNANSNEFIYHPHENTYADKTMDWLFLHESVPGHYFQDQFISKNSQCNNSKGILTSTVFAEGWGAYVETLGEQLGLYKDISSINYALDWQALRAVRVLLDIGIHYEGWSDKKAKKLWRQYIPTQNDIMEREISRIKNWPVQVITYVYGKVKILNTITRLQQQYPDINEPEIRRLVLTYSDQSISQLHHLLDAHIRMRKNKKLKIEEDQ